MEVCCLSVFVFKVVYPTICTDCFFLKIVSSANCLAIYSFFSDGSIGVCGAIILCLCPISAPHVVPLLIASMTLLSVCICRTQISSQPSIFFGIFRLIFDVLINNGVLRFGMLHCCHYIWDCDHCSELCFYMSELQVVVSIFGFVSCLKSVSVSLL